MTPRKNRYAYKTENLNKEILQEDYKQLQSVRKVAKKYNLNHKTMSNLLKKLGINFKPKLTRTKNNNIFSEENEASFYLAGFIAADGNILHRANSYHLSIRLGLEDENHLMKLQKLLGSNSKITEVKDHCSIINGRLIKSSNKGFTVCSKQIYYDLIKKFNITENKSISLTFPEHLSKHKLINHFIRGYFDGDGSFSIRNPNKINKQKDINIIFEICGAQKFVNEIKNILSLNLILPNNKIENRGNLYRIRYSGNGLSSIIGNWLYKDATIYLERKYERYLLAKQIKLAE